MQIEGWNVIDGDSAVLWREYAFARGAYATTLVFRGCDGLVVVSPSLALDARAFDALEDFGPVRALVANNRLHHLGQDEWRRRCPEAESYCPPASVAALTRKLPGVPFRPLSELPLPPHVHWQDAPGFKTGEAILDFEAAPGRVWFTGDLLTNIQRTPGPPLRWLFSLTGSAPGFRLFRMAAWLLVDDRHAVREWMLERLAAAPPAIVVPAHGPPVATADLAEQARRLLAKW